MANFPSFFSTIPSIVRPLPTGKSLNHTRKFIDTGDRGTAQTIRAMQDLVSQGKRDERVRTEYTIPIINGKYNGRNCAEKDYHCFCENIFLFCRDNIRYVHDPSGVELVEDAYTVLKRGAADCDSICILFASLCESVGRECRFVTIRKEGVGSYFHVYCEVNIPGEGWVGADCTMKDKPFGWRPDAKYPATSWPASKDATETDQADVAGFSGINEFHCQDHLDGLGDLDDMLTADSVMPTRAPVSVVPSSTSSLLPMAAIGLLAFFLLKGKR